MTGNCEVMHTAEAVVFARMPSGRDSPKTRRWSSLHSGLNAPPATSLTRRPQTCRLVIFFASLILTDRFGDLRLYQEDLIAIWVLKIKPLYA